jgi:DHA1 family bicyclomycin/chloramphenicol resistance-like MFS transporter
VSTFAVRRTPLVITLGALSGMAPLCIDMYVPAFPQLPGSLDTTAAQVQISLAAFLFGLVMGQLVFGPLSDRFGRRRLMLGGCGAAVVFTVLCAAAPSIEVFLLTRFLAGFAGAAGNVLARAVIVDVFRGPLLTRYTAAIGAVVGIAPVAAPFVGGLVVETTGSWRAIFLVLAGLGVLLTACVWRWVPETHPMTGQDQPGFRATFAAMGKLLAIRQFTGILLVLALVFAALYVYLADSAFVFQDHFGMTVPEYSVLSAVNALGLFLGSLATGLLARRANPRVTAAAGLMISVVAATAHALISAVTGGSLLLSWLCLGVLMFGFGLLIPSAVVLAQVTGSAAPGSAAALLGTAQFALGCVVSPLGGLLGSTGPTFLAVLLLVIILFAAMCYRVLAARRSGDNRPTLQASR